MRCERFEATDMRPTRSSERLLIVGVGNELLGDEGLGVHVAWALLRMQPALPPEVDVLEAGTALLDVLPQWSRYSRVVVVDAVSAGSPPGTIYRAELGSDSLDREPALPLSLHQWGLRDTLRIGAALDLLPRQLTLVGAEPEVITAGTELSPRLARAAQEITSMLLEEMPSIARPGRPGAP